MHIEHIEVGNFRKLQAVRIDLAEKTTLLVGANNSGKTSAMAALRQFLVQRSGFTVNDFTLSNWPKLNALGVAWEAEARGGPQATEAWDDVLPHVDVWLSVEMAELHYVQKILPTIDWTGGYIAVRLRYEPKDRSALKLTFCRERANAEAVLKAAAEGDAATDPEAFTVWPTTLVDYLASRVQTAFEVRTYLLDPAKLAAPVNGIAMPQALPLDSEPITGDAFKEIIRIDEISAQRGFGFPTDAVRADDGAGEMRGRGSRLSSQLRTYYTQHLDPLDSPEPKDFAALKALQAAQVAFGDRLEERFADALRELESLGYPGVTDPKLTITANVRSVDGLNHPSAVRYQVPTHPPDALGAHRLPEESNGLGYQNLVSMIFALMSYRDRWMRVGKAARTIESDEHVIPPLHLVLIEEPEVHLHAQVQQVFIRQAYEVLRKHSELGEDTSKRTQLVVSTHSSHIAHEVDFSSLRYFRRLPVKKHNGSVPVSAVVNLSEAFGNEQETARFVKRYLKSTHCDLFFADGAILVEGPAERILVPHFVRTREQYKELRRAYITWLEIGGSHAHRLRSLIEHLGISTLVVTDLDSKDHKGSAVPPARGQGLLTRNETLKRWVPGFEQLDNLFDAIPAQLVRLDPEGSGVRVAYQQPITISVKNAAPAEAFANTFEDAFLYSNMARFTSLGPTSGLFGRFRESLDQAGNSLELALLVGADLRKGGKAEFAMELLSLEEIERFVLPEYINQGLLWLAGQLRRKEEEREAKVALPSEPNEPLSTIAVGGQ